MTGPHTVFLCRRCYDYEAIRGIVVMFVAEGHSLYAHVAKEAGAARRKCFTEVFKDAAR